MPILQFVGLKAKQEVILELIDQITEWVASVKELEIGVENVTPIFVPSIQKNPGECVVFYVQELFEVSFTGKPRIADDRKKLYQAIKSGFNKFIATEKLDVRPTSVTVVIRRVDLDEEEYCRWDVLP